MKTPIITVIWIVINNHSLRRILNFNKNPSVFLVIINLLIQHLNDLHFLSFWDSLCFWVSRKNPSCSPFLKVFNNSNFCKRHTKLPQPKILDFDRWRFLFRLLLFDGLMPERCPSFWLLVAPFSSFCKWAPPPSFGISQRRGNLKLGPGAPASGVIRWDFCYSIKYTWHD